MTPPQYILCLVSLLCSLLIVVAWAHLGAPARRFHAARLLLYALAAAYACIVFHHI